jgi:hypothetical protein
MPFIGIGADVLRRRAEESNEFEGPTTGGWAGYSRIGTPPCRDPCGAIDSVRELEGGAPTNGHDGGWGGDYVDAAYDGRARGCRRRRVTGRTRYSR